jgi:ubiquitin-protein ligase
MNIRTRRLARDYEKVVAELAASEFARVEVVSGDPPNSYRVTYRVNGLMWDATANDAKPVSEHVVDIYLQIGYPKKQPHCTMRTPIWHPNIGDYVCIGDIWSAGVPLVDIIAHIGDMIQYKTYNLHSPVNKDAAAWAANRTGMFPVGDRNVVPAETDEKGTTTAIRISEFFDEVSIDLGPARERT